MIALVAGQPVAGTFLAIGAVSAGFGSFQGAYRSRAAIMLLAAGGMAMALFVGSLAGHSTLVASVVAGASGLIAGLFVALGPAAAFVALQSVVAVLVAAAFPADLHAAALRGLLVLAGGLFQVLLVVSLWPLRRFQHERQLIAGVYHSLAGYAHSLPLHTMAAPEPHTLARVGAVQRDPQPFARSSELLVFRGLLDEAERIRAGLAALSLMPAHDVDAVADYLGVVLREIADAVGMGRAPARLPRDWRALDAAAVGIRDRGTGIDALLAQLRAAFRMAGVPAIEPAPGDRPSHEVWRIPPVRDAVMTLRANVSLRSTAFRHALRLAAALALATFVYRWAELPRGYWFPMTALLVLKPEFGETMVAAITRVLGTLAGAALAALLVMLVGSEPREVTALLLVFVWGGYSLFRANYTAFTVCITGYVVLLLYLANAPAPATATWRAVDTIFGGALALVIYRLWPTWESSQLRELLAVQVEALARDADALLGAYVDPSTWDPKILQQTRAAARLARSNVEVSVERVLREPIVRNRFDGDLALSLLAAFRRFALGALALHAGLNAGPATPRPGLAQLRAEIIASLRILANALRHGVPPDPLPPLRQTQLALSGTVDVVVLEQTDVLVESINTVAALLA